MKSVYFWVIIAITIVVALGAAINSSLNVQRGSGAQQTTTIGPNITTINASEQQAQAMQYNLSLPSTYFQCGQSSDCQKALVSPCNNNEPSQFACINRQYYANYSAAYNSSVGAEPVACALFILDVNITCSCNQRTGSCDENYGFGLAGN